MSGTETEIAKRNMSQTGLGPQMPCRLPETFRQASGSFRKVGIFFLQLQAQYNKQLPHGLKHAILTRPSLTPCRFKNVIESCQLASLTSPKTMCWPGYGLYSA